MIAFSEKQLHMRSGGDTTVCSDRLVLPVELLACQCQACLGSILFGAYHTVCMDYNSRGCSKHVSCN